MDAMVMAGGIGKRLQIDIEKPLVEICGIPLLERVLRALAGSTEVRDVVVTLSHNTPRTQEWLVREHPHIPYFIGEGKGYIKDMEDAVDYFDFKGAILICMSDLPLLTPELIDAVIEEYYKSDKPALSVHVPLTFSQKVGIYPDTILTYKEHGMVVPSGINILRADSIRKEQEEHQLVLERVEAAVNVNRTEDIQVTVKLLRERGMCDGY